MASNPSTVASSSAHRWHNAAISRRANDALRAGVRISGDEHLGYTRRVSRNSKRKSKNSAVLQGVDMVASKNETVIRMTNPNVGVDLVYHKPVVQFQVHTLV